MKLSLAAKPIERVMDWDHWRMVTTPINNRYSGEFTGDLARIQQNSSGTDIPAGIQCETFAIYYHIYTLIHMVDSEIFLLLFSVSIQF